MKKIRLLLLIFVGVSCSLPYYQSKGRIDPRKATTTFSFTTYKHVVVVPVLVEGTYKNFILDTGAQLSLIQSMDTKGKAMRVTGASKRKVVLHRRRTGQLQIGNIVFKKVQALHGDFIGLKEQIPDFGGLIGQSILNKANWKIDYPGKILSVSSQDFPTDSFEAIPITREGGTPYTTIKIAGKSYKAMIDLGSSTRGLNIPNDHPLADRLLNSFSFEEQQRDIYSMGGIQLVTEQLGTLPFVWLDEILFKDVPVEIRNSSELRVGMNFFKDCILIIDNSDNTYKIYKAV